MELITMKTIGTIQESNVPKFWSSPARPLLLDPDIVVAE